MTAERLHELAWDVIEPSPHPAHMHMALDEVLLDRVIARERRPLMRIWEWIEPALVSRSGPVAVAAGMVP